MLRCVPGYRLWRGEAAVRWLCSCAGLLLPSSPTRQPLHCPACQAAQGEAARTGSEGFLLVCSF